MHLRSGLKGRGVKAQGAALGLEYAQIQLAL